MSAYAAEDRPEAYTGPVSELDTGWIVFAGTLLLSVFLRNQAARWVGVVGLSVGAVVALLEMPAYPLWGLTLFAISILAVYGLIAHGARDE